MFTSKKAQYLNKDFNRISPITNIDSLYYERAENVGDIHNSSYIIVRESVAKHMPIGLSIYDNPSCGIGRQTSFNVSAGEYKDVSLNNNYIKSTINYYNDITKTYKYEFDLFSVKSEQYVNLNYILNQYTPVNVFSSSINYINNELHDSSENISFVNDYLNNYDDRAVAILYDYLYNTSNTHKNFIYEELGEPSTNYVYKLIYYPYYDNPAKYIDASLLLHIQGVSIGNINDFICLGVAESVQSIDVSKWVIHYDFDLNKITYLKDEWGNEGSFDFRLRKTHNSAENDGLVVTSNEYNHDNRFLFDPENADIFLDDYNQTINVNSYNTIINSKHVLISNGQHNYIYNSNSEHIGLLNSSCNSIYNSSSNNIIIENGNSNLIINCNNSTIYISGNNNILINLENKHLELKDDNVIIGDRYDNMNQTPIELNHDRLFLNNSVSTAIGLQFDSYKTVYGGIENNVSVYYGGYSTLQ